ncbi:EGF-like domain-containing protein 1 isoform X2 [Liolophura sinensis]
MGFPGQYLFLLMFVVQTGGQTWKPYDCRRVNSQCRLNVGVCMTSTGMCDCKAAIPKVEGFEGFDCNLETNTIVAPSNCGITCLNGGTCYRSGTSHMCYCSEEYTGPTCEQARVDVTLCNETHIGMYIKPHHASIFNGRISIIQPASFDSELLLSDPACSKNGQNDKEADNSFLFIVSLDSSSPCYEGLRITNQSNGAIRYEYKMRVNYGLVQTFVDETHSFVCEINPNGNTGGVRVGTQRVDLNGTTVTGTHTPGTLRILTRSGLTPGEEASRLLYIGQQLFVEVSLKSSSTYTSLAVDSCVAFPNRDGTGQKIEFLTNRCPNADYLSVIDTSVGTIQQSSKTVLVAMYAIRFQQTNDLFISCNITLCRESNKGLCEAVDCPVQTGGPSRGFGRRKRDSDEAEYVSLTQHAMVVQSEAEIDAIRGCKTRTIYQTTETSCLQNTVFLVVTAVSVLLLTVTLVIAIVLCRRCSYMHKTSK